jgi:multiple sugar transport system ATP-binding protein
MNDEVNSEGKIILTCPKDAYVSLQHIDKVYDNGVQAVFDFSLDVKQHEFIVFVGPSGCGKSTTLRMIAGLEDITGGHLFIDHEYVNDAASKDRNIAMVFQSYALYPHMSVYDNMAFSLKINKVRRPIMSEESRTQVDAKQKELNALYAHYHKVMRHMDNLAVIKNQHQNATRDLKCVSDPKKAAKFQKKVDRLGKKLVDYDETKAAYEEYLGKIKKGTDELNEIIAHANYVYGVDEERIKELQAKLEDAEKINNATKIAELNAQIEKLRNTPSRLMKYTHLSKEEINRRIHEAAKILQIEDYLDRKPKALSGGQRQRVALGRAIVRNPKVFLMDEPLSNLDAKLRVQMRTEIVALHNKLNATTIYVTHDQTEAMTMASRIVVMREGRIQQIGTPIEIYQHPSNLFVASFIGSPSMNFFDATYSKGVVTLKGGLKIKVPANLYEGKDIPKNIVFGIRPDDVHPSTSDYAKDYPDSVIELKVRTSELLGSEYFIHSDYAGTDFVSKLAAKDMIKAGDTIKICLNLGALHIFDKETEKTII